MRLLSRVTCFHPTFLAHEAGISPIADPAETFLSLSSLVSRHSDFVASGHRRERLFGSMAESGLCFPEAEHPRPLPSIAPDRCELGNR